jgi:hypothetical protein
MQNNPFLGVLRHLLTFGGGYLVSNGSVSASQLEAGIGAIITLGGVLWSIYEKRKAR